MAGETWTWTARQWGVIVSLAQAERSNRRAALARDPVSLSMRSGSLGRANECAKHLREFARRAETGRWR